jgi:hypothetical protein
MRTLIILISGDEFMNKIIPIFVIIFLVIVGLNVSSINTENFSGKNQIKFLDKMNIKFSDILIEQEQKDYIRISLQDNEQYLMSPTNPMLPRILEKYELPFGVKNIKVTIQINNLHEQIIDKEILPTPRPIPLSTLSCYIQPSRKNGETYNSNEPYPSEWYSYSAGCGLNQEGKHVTFLSVNIYPIRYIPSDYKLIIADSADITITYNAPDKNIFPLFSEYDLLIITPPKFVDDLAPLITHKENFGINTLLKTTEDIYSEYNGRDKPEKIKYFLKDALETFGIKYVLFVGGLKSLIYAKPRDHKNFGDKGWHVPVRYSNLISGEPGYLCDLYYADIYKAGGEFDDWDSSDNNIFAEWPDENGLPVDILDMYPDLAFGRLACRNNKEVKDMVEKIITYETQNDPSWFKKMLVISGDGFLDQQDLDIKWDTATIPDGEYTIYAQSENTEGTKGPIDEIPINIDRTQETQLSFNHDDHLKTNTYPYDPIAEIVSISPGDILGNSDYTYKPGDGIAYCNDLFWWANISYINNILTIRGKSYDPRPYGDKTNIHVWIKNSDGETIFEEWRNNTKTYYEGEWCTGEKELNGRGGALYYMPQSFERELLWTSNGKFTGPNDVIQAFSEGYGFVFFSGHGSPNVWGDQNPGIPGNRGHSWVTGLQVSRRINGFPYVEFPMDELSNNNKWPVVVVGGCHNSMFNVSLIPTTLDRLIMQYFRKNIWMHTYGSPTPECWGWYMVKLPNTGAIATIGNTGYGWGWEGEFCTIGAGDGWVTSEFFRQYGEKDQEILGMAYIQSIRSYVSTFKDFTLPECWWYPDLGWDWIDEKSVQQWVLLGDPSLKMGGY